MRHYHRRSSNTASIKIDPEIQSSLSVLTQSVEAHLRNHRNPSGKEIDSWLTPFRKALGGTDEAASDEYGSLNADVTDTGKMRFLTVRMGSVTRTVAKDSKGRPIDLPREFSWNHRWDPRPIALPCGLVLMDESSIQAAGMRVGIRLVWLRLHGKRMTVVGRFEGGTTLDEDQARIKGNLVTAPTLDDPTAFSVSSSQALFQRETAWTCSPLGPGKPQVRLRQLPLRALDQAIFSAWHTRRPSNLQMQILKLWPRTASDQKIELGNWEEKPLSNGKVRLTIPGGAVVNLKRTSSGYSILDIHRSK